MADPSSVPAWIPIVSAVAGGVVVGIFGAINNYVNKKTEEKKIESEEKRQFRQLILTVATENWKHMATFIQEESKISGKSLPVVPVDAYIIHLTKLADVLLDSKLTKENIAEKLKDVHELSNAAQQIISEHSKKK